MQCKVLSELSRHDLPSSCRVSVYLTSERRHGDVTVRHNYLIFMLYRQQTVSYQTVFFTFWLSMLICAVL